jgi:chitin disaccharide deacetylase
MSPTNKLLGFPDDARLLIINADDFGMCHAINAGVFQAITAGVVQSTTLMTPCPGTLHALHLLQEDLNIAFGIHLTLICETRDYRWGPLLPAERAPSLIDETGYFYSQERRSELLAAANLAEVEAEFRAQIEIVLATGLQPTHLDWHCLYNGGRTDIFDLTLGLAKEYGLAVRVGGEDLAYQLQSRGLPTNDNHVLDSFRLELDDKAARYGQLLRELPEGLSEWAVHPGLDNAELQAIQPDGSRVRQTDLDFFVSDEARSIIQQEGIVLLSYKPMQAVWRSQRP